MGHGGQSSNFFWPAGGGGAEVFGNIAAGDCGVWFKGTSLFGGDHPLTPPTKAVVVAFRLNSYSMAALIFFKFVSLMKSQGPLVVLKSNSGIALGNQHLHL